MNKSQQNVTNEVQEDSGQGNPGVWSSWRWLPRVSLEWQVGLSERPRPSSSWAGQQGQHELKASPEQRGSQGQ